MLSNPNVREWWAAYSSTFLESDRDYINHWLEEQSLAARQPSG